MAIAPGLYNGRLHTRIFVLETASMYISNQSLIIIILVGGVAGVLARSVLRNDGFGLISDLAGGFIGALLGEWLMPLLGLHVGEGIVASIINAAVGAIVVLFILRFVGRGGRWGGGGWGRRGRSPWRSNFW